jgi:IclR family KDG regulon transcriptional repressor
LDRFLDRVELRTFTPKTISQRGPLKEQIEEVRRSGIAVDDGEFDPEVRCIGVPVRDFTGHIIGAIGISGPIWRLSLHALQGRTRAVQAAAERLSREFGTMDAGANAPHGK